MNKNVLIIAEAGVNHNGDMDMARRLVDAAAAAGADFVKFQTFKADKIVSKEARKAEYQIQNTGDTDSTQYNMLRKLELSEQAHYQLKDYCAEKGIQFLSTGFDEDSVDFLDGMGIPFFKVPSGELTNKPYLQRIAAKGKPVILSTGMADMEEISAAMAVLEASGVARSRITVRHCNTEYPTPMEDVNLGAMNHIRQTLGVAVGYSDHTLGIEVPVAAVALGATVIEKHFTLDKNLPGPDHKASLEPAELKAMVQAIRNIERAISGDGLKAPSRSETPNKAIARKSLHYRHDLPAGHVLTEADFIALRPGNGISPMEIDTLTGRSLKVPVSQTTLVEPEQLA